MKSDFNETRHELDMLVEKEKYLCKATVAYRTRGAEKIKVVKVVFYHAFYENTASRNLKFFT